MDIYKNVLSVSLIYNLIRVFLKKKNSWPTQTSSSNTANATIHYTKNRLVCLQYFLFFKRFF